MWFPHVDKGESLVLKEINSKLTFLVAMAVSFSAWRVLPHCALFLYLLHDGDSSFLIVPNFQHWHQERC
jgi:hypothetical protein